MKFKVGDEVIVIKTDGEDADKVIGKTGVIVDIDKDWVFPYEVKFDDTELQEGADGGWIESLFDENELKLKSEVEEITEQVVADMGDFIPTQFMSIKFQEGTVEENGVNGVQIEDVIDALVERLQGFQSGAFPCRENALAITHLQEAQNWLYRRTMIRKKQGVEGKHESHE